MAQGLDNKTIAARLTISVKTLDIHRGNISRKLGDCDSAAMQFNRIIGSYIATSGFVVADNPLGCEAEASFFFQPKS